MDKMKAVYEWCVDLIDDHPRIVFWVMAALVIVALLF